ncbi:DUF6515 family protein [Flavobacterium humidisoli]|uniref:DUF6515 family protein n=1 Tax=Flavobacterium humidisoli TaxID=2937442 RepID=UPI00211171E3|nr:DUF6515 family protein [Flavobacterium humidisoli]
MYYEKDGRAYKAVAPTAGTLVDKLPEGGEEVTRGDAKYVKRGETYCQSVQVTVKTNTRLLTLGKIVEIMKRSPLMWDLEVYLSVSGT